MFNEKKGCKLFIVEGENREKNIFEAMKKFFSWGEIKVVVLPAEQNIYMLWESMKKDDFQTDILEVIKEKVDPSKYGLDNIGVNDVDEIYLFFDYDAHHGNISDGTLTADIIKEMLDTFSNETELGKLYISYPMIEALRDWNEDNCLAYTGCVCNIVNFNHYKQISGDNNINANIMKYSSTEWHEVIKIYVLRISCLFDLGRVPTYQEYRNKVNPKTIFEQQMAKYVFKDKIFILSAIPEFLLEYFGEEFWKKWVHIKNLKKCQFFNR